LLNIVVGGNMEPAWYSWLVPRVLVNGGLLGYGFDGSLILISGILGWRGCDGLILGELISNGFGGSEGIVGGLFGNKCGWSRFKLLPGFWAIFG